MFIFGGFSLYVKLYPVQRPPEKPCINQKVSIVTSFNVFIGS